MTGRRSRLERFDAQLRKRQALGETYQELADWLRGRGVDISPASVWRYLNRPVRRPRRNERWRRWRRKHEAGASHAEIAKAEGVTRQAVGYALKRLAEEDTVSP